MKNIKIYWISILFSLFVAMLPSLNIYAGDRVPSADSSVDATNIESPEATDMGDLYAKYIDYTVEVNAPIDEVFALMSDIENWPTWITAMHKSKVKTKGRIKIGTKFKYKLDYPGLPGFNLRVKMYDYEVNRVMLWGAQIFNSNMYHKFEFTAVDENTTLVRHVEYADGVMARVANKMRSRIYDVNKQWSDELYAYYR